MAKRFGYSDIERMLEDYIHQNISKEEEVQIRKYYMAIEENNEKVLMSLLHENQVNLPSDIVKTVIQKENAQMIDIIVSSGRINLANDVNTFFLSIGTGKIEIVQPFLLYSVINRKTAKYGKDWARRLGHRMISREIKKYIRKLDE